MKKLLSLENSLQSCDTLIKTLTSIIYKKAGDVAKHTRYCISDVSKTYGEILPESVSKILRYTPLSPQDVFLDLGSGLGKLVIQVFLQSSVKEACGIEISPMLHQQAMAASGELRALLQQSIGDRKLNFLLGDFLIDSLPTATVALMSSPCFCQRIVQKLSYYINDTPDIHTVVSLRPMPLLKRLHCDKVFRIECSWDSSLCYIYR